MQMGRLFLRRNGAGQKIGQKLWLFSAVLGLASCLPHPEAPRVTLPENKAGPYHISQIQLYVPADIAIPVRGLPGEMSAVFKAWQPRQISQDGRPGTLRVNVQAAMTSSKGRNLEVQVLFQPEDQDTPITDYAFKTHLSNQITRAIEEGYLIPNNIAIAPSASVTILRPTEAEIQHAMTYPQAPPDHSPVYRAQDPAPNIRILAAQAPRQPQRTAAKQAGTRSQNALRATPQRQPAARPQPAPRPVPRMASPNLPAAADFARARPYHASPEFGLVENTLSVDPRLRRRPSGSSQAAQVAVAPPPAARPQMAPQHSMPRHTAHPRSGLFSVQTGAYRDHQNAQEMMQFLQQKGYRPFIVSRRGLQQIRFGAFAQVDQARQAARQARRLGIDAIPVRN